MRITGWEEATLRRQPARVIRAHFARIFVGIVWSPELAQAARGPAPSRSGMPLADYAALRQSKMAAVEALTALERALWPEDDDG